MSRAHKRVWRLAQSVALGAGAGAVAALARPDLAPLAGWVVAATSYSLRCWWLLWPLSPAEAAMHAAEEDPGRTPADLVLIVASLVSLGGVVVLLVASRSNDSLAAGTAVASVAASWLLVHTIYGIRYADLYFEALDRTGKEPIDFFDDTPNYVDFAYLTFCLGMTYQISDTTVRTRAMRRQVLAHTLLSYLFGAVILAATINLVVGLGS